MGQQQAGRPIVAVDFETYFDSDYSLKKLSTSEYVRDPRFEVTSVAIKVGSAPVQFYGGPEAAKAALDAIDWKNVDFLAHHAHFDGLILTHHFGHTPAYWRDTLSMGRALHPKFERNDLETLTVRYGVTNKRKRADVKGKRWADMTPEEQESERLYNIDDVTGMVEIYDLMLPKMPPAEMDIIDVTVRMFAEPVLLLNQALAKRELKREIAERKALIMKSNALDTARALNVPLMKPKKKGEAITDEMVLSSNKVFPELLRGLGIDPPMKPAKGKKAKPGEMTYALSKADEDFTDLIAHPDPRVVALVNGRLAAKSTIGETRAARLLRSGSDGKRLPVYLNYCGAHTTRFSGGDKLNYQNLKKKGDIRKAIKAPAGYKMVVLDSKTIEVRVLAWLAGQTWLLEAFRQGHDPYLIFAKDVYGREVYKHEKTERFVAKSCVLGLGYQMGGPKLQVSILAGSIIQGLPEPVRLELNVCYDLVNKYRSKNDKIVELWKFHNDTVIFELAFGRRGHRKEYKGIEYGREVVQLKDHLALHYPGCTADVKKLGAKGMSRTESKETRIDNATYKTPAGRTKMYGGMLTENIVQYLARMIVTYQMLAISRRYRVVMMTHDEVVYLVPNKEVKAAYQWGLEVMRTAPTWAPDLPLDAEGGYDSIYSK